ncbi:MAG: amino acid ABC transporter substrate-binding protein [Alphaproteobacteria bacterium]
MTILSRHGSRRVFLAGVATAALAVAGLVAEPASAQDKPLKIGFGMALTGGLAGAGKAALIGMQIWAEDINAKGGILGRKVELVYYDDQTNPATVPGLYTKLLDVDKVDFVVSGYGTNLIAPAMPIVIQRNKLFMGLFGLGNNEEYKYDRYFQILPAGPTPRRGVSADYFQIAKEQGLKKVAIVAADAEYAQNAAEGARQNAKDLGIEIVYDKSYPPPTADYTPIVRAINATNPDFVFAASYPPDSVGLTRALREVGAAPSIKMFGGGMVGLQYASVADALGAQINGIVNYDYYVPEPTLKFPGIEEFLAKYQPRAKAAGVDPLGHYLPPWAYAYLQVLADAITATKSFDDKVLAEYLHKTTFKTVVGDVNFGPNGEWESARVLFVQYKGIEDGKAVDAFAKPGARQILKPDEYKTADWLPIAEGRTAKPK